MATETRPLAVVAKELPERPKPALGVFGARLSGREKRVLGDVFGLTNFGVNLTRLPPGAVSALRHAHTRQDELVYILEGEPILVTDAGETRLRPGMCAGFKAGTGDAHHLVNRGKQDVVFIEVGDRSAGDEVAYPDDDLAATLGPDGKYQYRHKDGTPYY
ncbi:MAG: cupin domain-containing protein [Stellaceae bacterium]